MEEARIKNLIRTWRGKSHNEGDQFASFVFIWFCFNAWIEHLSQKTSVRGMIDELKKKSANMRSIIEAYDNAHASDDFFNNSLGHLIGQSQEESIKDARGQKQPITIRDENDFANIVEAIYRVRCNLFHGGKDANDTRDQVLVKNAAMILRQWIGKLIESWG